METTMNFIIDSSSGRSIGVNRLEGRLDAGNSKLLQTDFANRLQTTNTFVFDCTALEFIDSSGLGAMVSCLRKALDHRGDLRLAGLTPKVSLVFELTKAKQLFQIYPDIVEALQSYRSGTPV
jgi:anti-sigma B factor antagonist